MSGFRSLLGFVGRRVALAIGILWVLSIGFFGLELFFAFLLQQFLAGLGVVAPPNHRFIPSFLLTAWGVTILLAVVTSGRVLVGYWQRVFDGSVIEGFCHRIRLRLVDRAIQSTSIDSGTTLAFFNRTVTNASIAVQAFQQLVAMGILSVCLAAVLLVMSPRLALAFLGVGALGYLPLRVMHRRVKQSSLSEKETFDSLMKELGNVFRNLTLLRLHNLQGLERRRIRSKLDQVSDDILAHFRAEGAASALGPLFIVAGIVGVSLGSRFLSGPTLVPFLYLFIRLGQTIGPLAFTATRFSGTFGDFARCFDWWCETADADIEYPEPGASAPVRGPIGWHLAGLTFGYAGQPLLFDNLSLRIAPGSLVHISGPSGSGKTTLLAMMTGEAAPSSGLVEIEIDGVRSAVAHALPQLRDHIGYSSAEPYVFGGTIYENVVHGLREAPDESFLQEMVECAACEFIFQLPEGFQYRIDEHGHGVSTGQRQRLALLRALLRKPKALVLDEALSNVDDATEENVLRHLMTLRSGCTTVWISHRQHAGLAPDDRIELTAAHAVI